MYTDKEPLFRSVRHATENEHKPGGVNRGIMCYLQLISFPWTTRRLPQLSGYMTDRRFFLRNQRTRNSTKMTKSYDYVNKSLLIALTPRSLFTPAMYYILTLLSVSVQLASHFAPLGRVSQRSSK